MSIPRIVIDTNVLVAALRSKRGASHRLLLLLGTGSYEAYVSVPLALEYEAAAKRLIGATPLLAADIDGVLDYVFSACRRSAVFYLWRPYLRDPSDDMVLELAVSAGCEVIVTYNKSDYGGAERFGIRIMTSREFLAHIGEVR